MHTNSTKNGIGSALRRIEAAERLLVLLNFDGTMIPIGDEIAKLPSDFSDWLGGLAGSEKVTVGIASGRAVDDLMAAIRVDRAVFAGNHGNEIRGMGLHFVEPVAFLCEPVLRELVAQMDEHLRDALDARIVNKRYSATLHLRGAAEEEKRWAVANLREAMRGRERLTLVDAKESIEIVPNNGWNMVEAVRWIVNRLGLADALLVYAGDDAADESVFAAYKAHVTVKVGCEPSVAEYALDGPPALWRFVSQIGNGLFTETRSGSG